MKGLSLLVVFVLVGALFLTGCGVKSTDCRQPEVFCVGLVTDGGPRDDHSYNQAAWDGLQQAHGAGVVDQVASIETADIKDYADNIATFTQAGYDVVVTVGDGMSEATRVAAKAFPDTYFIGVDQDQSTSQDFSPNLVGLVFAEDQIGFLAGALSAWMTKTGQVGAVCGSDSLPAMKLYGAGFLAGAAYANPAVTATVVYHNEVAPDSSLQDPLWGAGTANSLVDSGADIIFAVGGGTGINALVAAVARGAYAVGADTDQYNALPIAAPHLYASVLKKIAPGVAALIKAAADAQTGTGVFPSGNYQGDIGLSSYHDLESSVPGDVKSRMSTLEQDLLSGAVQTGVTLTNP